jgi:hypothetical protein
MFGFSLAALLKNGHLIDDRLNGPGIRQYARPTHRNVPASINRRTGKPHEHKREIARRRRQAERKATRSVAP